MRHRTPIPPADLAGRAPSRTRLLALAALFAALGAACRAAAEVGRPPTGEPLVVLSSFDAPPFVWLDEEGWPRGRDVDLVRRIARELGRPIVWRRLPFAELLPALEAGEGQLATATIGVTPEREERVDFGRPTFRTWIAVLARRAAGEPRTLAGLEERAVAAEDGTTAAEAVRERLPGARLVPAGGERPSAVELLLAGEADAAALDAPEALRLAEAEGRLVVLDEPLAPETYALAFAPHEDALRKAANEVLERMQSEGSLDALDRAYGLREAVLARRR